MKQRAGGHLCLPPFLTAFTSGCQLNPTTQSPCVKQLPPTTHQPLVKMVVCVFRQSTHSISPSLVAVPLPSSAGSFSSATCVATSAGTQSFQRSQARPRPSHRLPQCSPHSCCRPRGRPSTLRPLTLLRSRACCNSKSACSSKVKLPG